MISLMTIVEVHELQAHLRHLHSSVDTPGRKLVPNGAEGISNEDSN